MSEEASNSTPVDVRERIAQHDDANEPKVRGDYVAKGFSEVRSWRLNDRYPESS